jgi:oxygen-independent coproporphyrinogen-3 oxidase
LHAAFLELSGGVDASFLAYVGRGRQRLTEDEVADLWKLQAQRTGPDAANHIYVHVPFCKSICSFCNYTRLRPGRVETMQLWSERILRSIRTLGPATAGMAFHNLYFGGGTPSVLTLDILKALLEAIDEHFTFHPWAHKHLELDPAIIDAQKLALLRKHGFDHLSFGIQTLDPDVNALHRRGRQDHALVHRRLQEFAGAGISQVSCDFLLGLAGSRAEVIIADLEEVLAHPAPPGHIDLFFLIPTTAYLQEHFGGHRDAFEAHLAPFRELARTELPRIARERGYLLRGNGSHGYTMRRMADPDAEPPPQEVPGYTQHTHLQGQPLNLLGIGSSARSHLFGAGQLVYQPPNGDPAAPGAPWYDGRLMDLADEARAYLVMKLRDASELKREDFRRIFGREPEAVLPTTFAAWDHIGVLESDDEAIRLKPEAPLQRKQTLLWVVADEGLEGVVAKHLGLSLQPDAIGDRLGLRAGDRLGHAWLVGHEPARTRVRVPAGEVLVRWAPTTRSRSEPLRVRAILERAPDDRLEPRDVKVVRALERLFNTSLGAS